MRLTTSRELLNLLCVKTCVLEADLGGRDVSTMEVEIREKDHLIEVAANAEERQRYKSIWDGLRDKIKALQEDKIALRREASALRRKQWGLILAWILISKGVVAALFFLSKRLVAARTLIAKGLEAAWLLILRVLEGVLSTRATASTVPPLISSVLTNLPTESPAAPMRSSGHGRQMHHSGYESISQETGAKSGKTRGRIYDHFGYSDDFAHQSEESHPIHLSYGLPEYRTGLDKRAHWIQERLKNSVVLGIFGMGGIGKTTLAKQVFNNISVEYEYTCFVENVKLIRTEDLGEYILSHFHRKGQKELRVQWVHFQEKKTLIVMDDVDTKDQLKVLPLLHSFGNGSHLIITSRNKGVLDFYPQYEIYDVDFLGEDEAKELFCHHAFCKEEIPIEAIQRVDHLEEYVQGVIDECLGLPLNLEVMGRYLRDSYDATLWKKTLDQLSNPQSMTMVGRVRAILRVSFDALDKAGQEMFIEAGTFFLGQQLEHALAAWRARDEFPEVTWAKLVSRGLVKTYRMDKWDDICDRYVEYVGIWVHRQLCDLAKEILESDMVSSSDGEANSRKFPVHANWWRLETNIKPNENQTMNLSNLPENSEKLKYIDLDGVQNEGLDKNFPAELVLLKWKQSFISQLPPISLGKMTRLAILELEKWSISKSFPEALGNLTELRILSLCSLEGLDDLPKTFGRLSSLKHLTLRDVGIRELPKSFGNLQSLVTLKIRDCSELSSLPDTFGRLSSLKELYIYECAKLSSLPDSFCRLSSLEELYIYKCPKLSTLGESFGHLNRLKHMSLKRCESLGGLPANDKGLSCGLKELVVDGCSSLQGLATFLGQCKALERLTIQGGVPKNVLSGNFGSLPALKYLALKQCWKLEGLPPIRELPFLEELVLERCNQLQGLPENFDELTSLKRLVIEGAYCLKVLPDSVARVSSLREVIISKCNRLKSLPRSLGKPFSKNNQDIELKKAADTDGVRLHITKCEFLKEEKLKSWGFEYDDHDGCWYRNSRR